MADGERRIAQEDRLSAEWRKSVDERRLESEGIPVMSVVAVPDLRGVEVAPWPRLEARWAQLRLHPWRNVSEPRDQP